MSIICSTVNAAAAAGAAGRSTICTVGDWLAVAPDASPAATGAGAPDADLIADRSSMTTVASWPRAGGRRTEATCAWARAPAEGDADTCEFAAPVGSRLGTWVLVRGIPVPRAASGARILTSLMCVFSVGQMARL